MEIYLSCSSFVIDYINMQKVSDVSARDRTVTRWVSVTVRLLVKLTGTMSSEQTKWLWLKSEHYSLFYVQRPELLISWSVKQWVGTIKIEVPFRAEENKHLLLYPSALNEDSKSHTLGQVPGGIHWGRSLWGLPGRTPSCRWSDVASWCSGWSGRAPPDKDTDQRNEL